MPKWKWMLLRAVAILLAASVLVYAGDDLSLRLKFPSGRHVYGSVQVQPYYLIHKKNGKVEYDFNPPEDDTCVNSLFPHFGFQPCWYLRRHPEKEIEI